ncbi:hypothetical protein HDC30_002375 [Pseudomonas sp. JAI115]|nr:hypothetical protein [Pseudomonas sp. JAI115]
MEPLEAINQSEDGFHRCYTVQNGRHYCQPIASLLAAIAFDIVLSESFTEENNRLVR